MTRKQMFYELVSFLSMIFGGYAAYLLIMKVVIRYAL